MRCCPRCRPGSRRCPRCPATSTSSSSTSPRSTRRSWNKAMVPDAAAWLDAVIAGGRGLAVGGPGAARAVHGARRGARCQPPQVPGAGACGADGAVASGRRCSSRWSCWVATRCWPGCVPHVSASARRAERAVATDRADGGGRSAWSEWSLLVAVVYVGVIAVQVVMASRPGPARAGRRDRRPGRRPVRRHPVAGAAAPPRPCARAVRRRAGARDRADGLEAARRPLHRGVRRLPLPDRRRACPSATLTIVDDGASTYESLAAARRVLRDEGCRLGCSWCRTATTTGGCRASPGSWAWSAYVAPTDGSPTLRPAGRGDRPGRGRARSSATGACSTPPTDHRRRCDPQRHRVCRRGARIG